MNQTRSTEISQQAVPFSKPLFLTPQEDLLGYIISHLGRAFLFIVASVSVLAVFLIFFFILKEAFPFFAWGGLSKFFGSTHWYPEAEPAEFGALAIIFGSLYVTIGALIFAVPIGILVALFLSDMAPFRLREICKPVIEILAAIPSVAYGFFAVLVLAPWLQNHLGFPTGTNALNASFILAVMALPTIISVSEDAISATGREIREASFGLGATRAETLVKVIIPAAHSGIVAGAILGMMRAIGETMVVWMASGNASQIPSPWWDLSQSIRTMTATIAGDMGETPKGSNHYMALFGLGALLLLFTFILNLISEYFLSRVRSGAKKSK